MSEKVRGTRTSLSQGILSLNIDDHLDSSSVNRSNQYSPIFQNHNLQASPRQTTPTKSRPVPKPEYVTELSLSEADFDTKNSPRYISTTKRRLPHVFHEVLTTEVDDEQDFSKSGEISTKTFKMQSPARVICHSPSSFREGSVPHQQKKLKEERIQSAQPKSLSFDSSNELSTLKHKGLKNQSLEVEATVTKSVIGGSSGTKKKKKKFIQVESRFKQASKKDETLKSKSLELSAITPHPSQYQSSQTQQQQKKSRVTSTPFLMTSMYEGQLPYDGSILEQTRFQVANEPPIKQSLVKKTLKVRKEREASAVNKKDLNKRKEQIKDTSKETKAVNKGSVESDQLMMDLYYGRSLQQTYLNMKAIQTFDKQEEKSKDEMYALWAINRKIEKEIEALTLVVKTLRMEFAIDQLLNVQVEGIKPLSGKLSKLIIKSNRFTNALSNISHYLDFNAISIGNEDSLLCSLDDSKQLLAGITSLTRRHQPQIEELSTSSEVLMKTVKSEIREQSRCSELLGACSSLMNKELSLQAQVLQT